MSLDPYSDIAFLSKHHLQLVLLGDSGVGKSCIVLRFVRGQFDPTSKVRIYRTNVFLYHVTSSYRIWFPPPTFFLSFWCALGWLCRCMSLLFFKRAFIILALMILGDCRSFFSVSNNSVAGLNYS